MPCRRAEGRAGRGPGVRGSLAPCGQPSDSLSSICCTQPLFAYEGAGLTYQVVVEELAVAARDVRAITASATAGTVETLPAGVDVGHDRLTVVLWDFCGRWDTGLSHLVGDSEEMATRLDGCAHDYARREDESRGRYERHLSPIRRSAAGGVVARS